MLYRRENVSLSSRRCIDRDLNRGPWICNVVLFAPLLTGLIITAALMLISGMHHTDALADFADGLMTKGGKETKHKAMRDPSVGSAEALHLVLYVAGMIIAISGFHQGVKLLTGIITAEVTAKYVMVLQAHTGSPAWEGFSSPFTARYE